MMVGCGIAGMPFGDVTKSCPNSSEREGSGRGRLGTLLNAWFNSSSCHPHPVTPQGNENKGGNHQKTNVLVFRQILPTGTLRNIRTTVRRIYMLILGLKGLTNGFVNCLQLTSYDQFEHYTVMSKV